MTLNGVMAVTLLFPQNSVPIAADYVKVVEDTARLSATEM